MSDIKTQIQKLAGSYVGVELTEANVLMYCMRLAEIPPDELEVAIEHVTDTCKFFPSIAEIKDAHRELFGRQISNAYELAKPAPKPAYHMLHDGEGVVG